MTVQHIIKWFKNNTFSKVPIVTASIFLIVYYNQLYAKQSYVQAYDHLRS